MSPVPPPRLCLITPPLAAPEAFAPALEAALAAGDVASLIVVAVGAGPAVMERVAGALTPLAQRRGVAVLIHNDTRIAGHVRADGVHVDSGAEDLRDTVRRLRPERIVGAGALASRHDAMTAGEADPDYVFFGRLDGDDTAAAHPKALELAAWWAPLFRIPAMLMAGNAVDSVREAVVAGVEFVALGRAVWEHPDGPAAAVAAANRLLAETPERVG